MGIRRMLNYEEYDEVINMLDKILSQVDIYNKTKGFKKDSSILTIQYIIEDLKELIR